MLHRLDLAMQAFFRRIKRGETLGVDRGVHVLAALSDGALICNAAVGEMHRATTAHLQRELDAATQKGGFL